MPIKPQTSIWDPLKCTNYLLFYHLATEIYYMYSLQCDARVYV